VRIRSVQADPGNSPDTIRSALWLAAVLRDRGFPEVEVWRTGVPPPPRVRSWPRRGVRAHLAATGREAPAVDLTALAELLEERSADRGPTSSSCPTR
jgi:hypothetical protein